ncbi:hypothetical protein GIB67_009881 [Kingdonia uniflora]|uniref:Cytochrome b5 heme-binding domain-containing protein n=1 Tax=Kingdonia uniflora TaxID=39325 RepID=A0A7J7L7S8_9MAGN|nr:hypothetical protein GIB67_009881 [Kingdonia uniflora]
MWSPLWKLYNQNIPLHYRKEKDGQCCPGEYGYDLSSHHCWEVAYAEYPSSMQQVYDAIKFLEDNPGGDEVRYKILSQTLSFVCGVVGKGTTDDFGEDVGHSSCTRAMMDEYYREIDSSTKQKSPPPKQPQYNLDTRLQTMGKNICA